MNRLFPLILLQPGVWYGDRINQLVLRLGKVVQIGRYRSSLAVDFLTAPPSKQIPAQSPRAFVQEQD